jgi:hypothetical protein
MEKEKRKGRPSRGWITFAVVIGILASFCAAITYFIIHARSLSDFSRFETEEEVVAFLYQHLERHITTSDDILTFMDDYRLMFDGCGDSPPRPDDIVDEEVTKIIYCTVPTWGSIAGTFGYTLKFYINADGLLVNIEVQRFCMCL